MTLTVDVGVNCHLSRLAICKSSVIDPFFGWDETGTPLVPTQEYRVRTHMQEQDPLMKKHRDDYVNETSTCLASFCLGCYFPSVTRSSRGGVFGCGDEGDLVDLPATHPFAKWSGPY